MDRSLAALLAVALAIAVAACGSSNKQLVVELELDVVLDELPAQPGKGKPAVTIGDKNFTEQYILGELYAQALRAKGFTVKLKSNIGSSEIIDKALTSGQDRHVPRVHRRDPLGAGARDQAPGDRRRRLRGGQEVRGGARLHACSTRRRSSTPTRWRCKPDFATKNNLVERRRPQEARQQAEARRARRSSRRASRASIGLKKDYGLNARRSSRWRSACSTRRSTRARSTSADVFTTDGQLRAASTRCSKDPKNIFGFQNVAPIVSKKVLTAAGPGVRRDAQRGQREADDRGDAEDERRRRPRQAEAGRRRQGVPAGERARLG